MVDHTTGQGHTGGVVASSRAPLACCLFIRCYRPHALEGEQIGKLTGRALVQLNDCLVENPARLRLSVMTCRRSPVWSREALRSFRAICVLAIGPTRSEFHLPHPQGFSCAFRFSDRLYMLCCVSIYRGGKLPWQGDQRMHRESAIFFWKSTMTPRNARPTNSVSAC